MALSWDELPTAEPWAHEPPPADDPPSYSPRDPWRWYPDGKPVPEGWEDGMLEDDEPTFEPWPKSHSERGKVHGAAKRALPESRRRRP